VGRGTWGWGSRPADRRQCANWSGVPWSLVAGAIQETLRRVAGFGSPLSITAVSKRVIEPSVYRRRSRSLLFSGLPPPALHASSAQPPPPVMNLIHVWRYQVSGPNVSGEYPNVNEMTLNAAREAFERGYLDAWSIRGDGLAPPVPAYSVEPGEDPYRAGVARAVRDAARKALATTTGRPAMEIWLNSALRRGADR
jgi:hypothetical protein